MTDYKKDFPLLKNSQVAYLDNAATAQRPQAVLEAEEVCMSLVWRLQSAMKKQEKL